MKTNIPGNDSVKLQYNKIEMKPSFQFGLQRKINLAEFVSFINLFNKYLLNIYSYKVGQNDNQKFL